MVSKPRLTEFEKGTIMALFNEGRSQREIALSLNRSRCAVQSFIKNRNRLKQAEKRGTASKLSSPQRQALVREACKGDMHVSELKRSSICQLLSAASNKFSRRARCLRTKRWLRHRIF